MKKQNLFLVFEDGSTKRVSTKNLSTKVREVFNQSTKRLVSAFEYYTERQVAWTECNGTFVIA